MASPDQSIQSGYPNYNNPCPCCTCQQYRQQQQSQFSTIDGTDIDRRNQTPSNAGITGAFSTGQLQQQAIPPRKDVSIFSDGKTLSINKKSVSTKRRSDQGRQSIRRDRNVDNLKGQNVTTFNRESNAGNLPDTYGNSNFEQNINNVNSPAAAYILPPPEVQYVPENIPESSTDFPQRTSAGGINGRHRRSVNTKKAKKNTKFNVKLMKTFIEILRSAVIKAKECGLYDPRQNIVTNRQEVQAMFFQDLITESFTNNEDDYEVNGLNSSKSKVGQNCDSIGNSICGGMSIKSIKARQIFDSRGNPTVEVDLEPNFGGVFRAAVPSGASTGLHEALELRDGEKENYHGKGVQRAVDNINTILGPALIEQNFDLTNQCEIDDFMLKLDGTENKSKFGANAILGISLAVCKAGAAKKGIPLYMHIAELAGNTEIILPVPAFNVINGGSHAGNRLAMQEFMILPTGACSFKEAMKMGTEVYHHLKKVILEKFGLDATAVGDEGGFAPNITDNMEGLTLITEAINKAGYTGKVGIGMDVAASEFFKDGLYDLDFKNPNSDKSQWLSPERLTQLYQCFINEYPIISIEDPFDQDHWDAWVGITSQVPIQIVGDDLTVTNPQRIQTAVERRACNCLLLKVNQIGTVTESIQAHLLAKQNGWGTMVSHRSGETEDTFIADLVVGLSTGQIKTGAPCRSERLAKYNQILRIEEELGPSVRYAGNNFRQPFGSHRNSQQQTGINQQQSGICQQTGINQQQSGMCQQPPACCSC